MPGPPYSSGMWVLRIPSSHALRRISSGHVAVAVVVPGHGAHLVGGEVVRHLAQALLLIGQGEVDHVIVLLEAPSRRGQTGPSVRARG